MSDEPAEQDTTDGTPKKRRMPLWALFLSVGWTLKSMLEAALVRGVAYGWFSRDPDAFRGHPNDGSLTWKALELRAFLVTSLRPEKVTDIPVDQGLVILLQNSRDKMLQQCEWIADGVPLPPRPQTALEKHWAAALAEQDRRMGKTE